MSGSAARYVIMPGSAIPDGGGAAAVAAAARRIARLTPADAECLGILTRLSMQLAEATEALENDTRQKMSVTAIYEAGQASAGRHLRGVPAPRQ